jgi:hypothetical protein
MALSAWFHALPDCWSGPFKGINRRRHLVAVNLAACVGMMRQEFQWDCHFNVAPDSAPSPSLSTYLTASSRSIGVFPISALAATFDRRPLRRWQQSQAAVQAGGLVVRLANDIATYATDVAEGNVTAVTLTLARLGLPRQAAAESEEAHTARAHLVPVLDAALSQFSAAQASLQEGMLSYTLRQVVALALAIYGDGERYRSPSTTESKKDDV